MSKKDNNRVRVEFKWFDGLDKKFVDTIKALQPDDVACAYIGKEYTVFVFEKNGYAYVGVAICSTLEPKFDRKYGKKKAVARALEAFRTQKSGGYIRRRLEQFPGGWTISQARRVINAPGVCKSMKLDVSVREVLTNLFLDQYH